MSFFKEIYGVGILFFYYIKFPLVIGWAILYLAKDYPDNIIMHSLWLYCVILIIKDIIYKFIFKKNYCEEASLRHTTIKKEEKNETDIS